MIGTWQERLNILEEEATRTNIFNHNPTVQQMYYRLMAAIERKDGKTTRNPIEKMGF